MYLIAKNGLSIHDIQQIFFEDQCLFDKTIAVLKQRKSIGKLNAGQPQHHLNTPYIGEDRQGP